LDTDVTSCIGKRGKNTLRVVPCGVFFQKRPGLTNTAVHYWPPSEVSYGGKNPFSSN